MSRSDYAHHNEDADYYWYQEEGRFGSEEPEYDPDDFMPEEEGDHFEDDEDWPADSTFKTDQYRGVAFRVMWIDGQDGKVVGHMVGDDRQYRFDREDIFMLEDGEFCSLCGQIGCGHGG